MDVLVAVSGRFRSTEQQSDGSWYSPVLEMQFWCDASGKFHRDGDLPAVIHDSGRREWHVHGLAHREGGPAVIAPKPWQVHRVRRDDFGVAIRDELNTAVRFPPRPHTLGLVSTPADQVVEAYYVHGVLSRTDGPARTFADGTREYWVEGVRSRPESEGPAVEYPRPYGGWASGPDEWWQDGRLHRVGGPALEPFRTDDGWLPGPGLYFLHGFHLPDVRTRWLVLRHYVHDSERPTLTPDNTDAWELLVSVGAVNVAREVIEPDALAAALRVHPTQWSAPVVRQQNSSARTAIQTP